MNAFDILTAAKTFGKNSAIDGIDVESSWTDFMAANYTAAKSAGLGEFIRDVHAAGHMAGGAILRARPPVRQFQQA